MSIKYDRELQQFAHLLKEYQQALASYVVSDTAHAKIFLRQLVAQAELLTADIDEE